MSAGGGWLAPPAAPRRPRLRRRRRLPDAPATAEPKVSMAARGGGGAPGGTTGHQTNCRSGGGAPRTDPEHRRQSYEQWPTPWNEKRRGPDRHSAARWPGEKQLKHLPRMSTGPVDGAGRLGEDASCEFDDPQPSTNRRRRGAEPELGGSPDEGRPEERGEQPARQQTSLPTHRIQNLPQIILTNKRLAEKESM